MGLYYPTCAISGIALTERSAGVLLLRRASNAWLPVSFPIWGHCDGYGSLERIHDDQNVRLVTVGFAEACRRRIVEIRWPRLAADPHSLDTINDILHVVSRSVASPEPGVFCEEDEISYSFVSTELTRCLQAIEPFHNETYEPSLTQSVQPARAFYSRLSVEEQSWFELEMSRFRQIDLAVERSKGWAPPELHQFSVDEEIARIRSAMTVFGDIEPAVEVLRELEAQVGE
jgi:hypothetical protein